MAVPAALADANNKLDVNATETPTITPTPAVTPTPTSVASPTAVPTPGPRDVFGVAKWENDHVTITVNNNGQPITVEGYIESQSNKNIVPVDAGANRRVNTNSIVAEPGQIVLFGFKAYENGTLIDTFESSLAVPSGTQVSPTPPPETAGLSGSVVDAATNAPIEGAEVVLKSQTWGKQYTLTTDSAGTYLVQNIYPDNYNIIITKSGYKSVTTQTAKPIEGMQEMDTFTIQKVPAGVTPTPTTTPTPSSTANPLDAWISLLSSPTACIATAGGGVGLILSLTALYEWIQRQKERRLRDQQQHPPTEQPPKK